MKSQYGSAAKAAPETAKQAPSPRELMRARHPDLFSDSVVQSRPVLARPVFDHHLDTLTARKEENQFEHFCRLIAEKEICPNLRIQTGPTGGGDSKVDSESYPVAKEIADRWWFGEPAGGAERWAFAFSAKKKWKPKLEADVESVLSTKRDYKRIYFFTNQLVSDKLRASTEDTVNMVSRINRMTPATSENLTNFLKAFNKFNAFFLMPAQLPTSGQSMPEIEFKLALLKRHLHIRPAWQIGENDPDIVALDEDEDPFIPDGVVTAPVLKVIASRRVRRNERMDPGARSSRS